MKNLIILALICLTACTKAVDKPASAILSDDRKQSCDFGITNFNLSKRSPVNNEIEAKGRPIKSSGTTSSAPPSNSSVIFLDFDGHLVSNTSWNYSGDINCASSNLTTTQMTEILLRMTNDFSPFNIIITTDQATYNAANVYKRMRVVFTESWEWYGKAGGVSYTGSFTWGDNTPCFVFSSLLNYDTKSISEAASHEAGHTLGLRHQASYDANGVKTSDYNYGQGSGEIGWAPIMGVGYGQNLTIWHNGPTPYGTTSLQDDVAVITGVVGLKGDDYSNTNSGASPLVSSMDGMINNNTDVDFFSIDINTSKQIALTPFNVGGANNPGADVDLLLNVYNAQGSLIKSLDDASILNVSTILNAGKYYLAVTTTPNQFASKYGMLGKYTVSVL